MKNYTLTWVESSNHIPERPELTATRHHRWSWYREYQTFDKGEDLLKFLEEQPLVDKSISWQKWLDYNVAVIKYRKERKANKDAFLERIKKQNGEA